MNRAVYSGTARVWSRTDERETDRKEMKGSREIDLPVGDSNARVSSTRGFKTWFSSRAGGLTVEATVNVSIVCGQSEDEINAAVEEASRIAEGLAIQGNEEMGLHLESFAKELE